MHLQLSLDMEQCCRLEWNRQKLKDTHTKQLLCMNTEGVIFYSLREVKNPGFISFLSLVSAPKEYGPGRIKLDKTVTVERVWSLGKLPQGHTPLICGVLI